MGVHPIIRSSWAPHLPHDAVPEDGVAAELAGVLHGTLNRLPSGQGTRVPSERARRVGPEQPSARQAEPAVQQTLLVGEEGRVPREVVGQPGQRVRWAEADREESRTSVVAGVAVELLHLDQVLLTGKSIPVSDQRQDVQAGKISERYQTAGAAVGQGESRQIDRGRHRLGHRSRASRAAR